MVRRQVGWIVAALVIATGLGLTACSPAGGSTHKTTSQVTSGAPSTAAPATTSSSAEEPQYGGTFNFIYTNPLGFDPADTFSINCNTALGGFTNNELLMGDWAKGPAGTGQTDWQDGFLGHISLETGCLAQSWEMPDDSTIVFHLRHGVHYYVQPGNAASELVGGRELTADDVVWSANREFSSSKSFLHEYFTPDQRPLSFTAPDKYTVQVKVPPADEGNLLLFIGDQMHIYAPEVVAKYGSYDDWHNQVGTGPFMLQDYVSDSEITYVRNPNFFLQDPLHPNNQLPYVNECNQLIITDHSTQLAALRTGKIDEMGVSGLDPLNWEDKEELSSNAQLQWKQIAGASYSLWGREDKANLPFKNLLVRQAMNLAIDQPGIVSGYYKGNADLLATPFPPYKAWQDLYTPLDQMPSKPTVDGSQASVQELFTYEPDKAKQLLAQAGYPNGFKTQVVCTASQSDFLSIIKDQLSKVGIDLAINVVDPGVWASINRSRGFPEMFYSASPTAMFPPYMLSTRVNQSDDPAFFSSPVTDAAYAKESPYIGKDDTKWASIVKGVTPYILEEAPGVWLPAPWAYRAWWPWLKNYDGEGPIGFDNQMAITWYVWIDQSLKKSMGF